MSYEYPFDDDREVTVGDLRILQHTLLIMASLLIGYVFFGVWVFLWFTEPLASVAVLPLFGFFMGYAWVHTVDGRLRYLVGKVREFDSPALSQAEFGRDISPTRGDD